MAYRIVLRKEGNRLYKDVSDYLRRHLSTVFTSDLGLLAKALVGGNEVAEASQDVTGEDLSYAAEEFIDGCLAVWLRYSSRLEEMAYPLDYLVSALLYVEIRLSVLQMALLHTSVLTHFVLLG
jgi:hypothetical protein